MLRFLVFTSFLLGFGLLSGAERPNILLIMADDMGWSDIGCYGGEIETPNIDRLAGEGMRFTQFYNNGKCTTTRASLLTGLYPRNGGKGIELHTSNMVTLGEALTGAGYATGLSGKWHNGNKAPNRPFDRGFQKSYGLWDGCCNFFDPSRPDPEFKGGKVRFFGEDDRQITEFPDDFFTTEAFADHTIATIQEHVKAEKPFFHYLPFTAPHYPLHARPEDIAKFEGRYDVGWDAIRETRYARQVEMGLIDPKTYPEPGPNPDNGSWTAVEEKMLDYEKLRMEVYAAMVYRMDQEIGRILNALDELGIAENTMILFLSDNGGCAEQPGGRIPEQVPGPEEYYSHCGPDWAYAQNTPFKRYKSHTQEGGIATPLVVRWPAAIKAGTITDQVGHIIDFMPTFLDAANGEYPVTRAGVPVLLMEGVSLLPVLTGEETSISRPAPLFWHWAKNRAIRDGDWKLVWEQKAKNGWELYNLKNDRTETKNLAEEVPNQVRLLSEKWEAWAHFTGVH
ncbi:MAG: arylsulfatase [Verrucomicrobiales bacterium]|nr:arylsulfatase [Verrucomicrobiales bacterium]